VQQLVAASSNTHKGLVAGTISVFVLLLGATSVFTELQNALDRIWHVPPSQKPTGVWAMLRSRLLSFGLILGLVFLLMVSLLVSTLVAAFGTYTTRLFPGAEVLLQVVNTLVSLAISTGLFAMIYKMLPNTRIAWRDVWVGAIVTAVMFEVGKFLIGLYLGKSSMSQTFAAAGSLVILIAWIYYAAQIFLLGAEFTKLYAEEHGSRAAAQALQGTSATAQAGVPVAAQVAVPGQAQAQASHHGHHAGRKPSPEREAAIARLQYNREQLRQTEPPPRLSLAKSAVTGASTVAGMAVAAWARRAKRKHQAPA
jgi:membrane protein